MKSKKSINRIECRDSIAAMRDMNAGTIDLVFADPPYNIGYDYDVYNDSRSADDYLAWAREWTTQVHRVLKPTGTFWLAVGDDFAAEHKVMLTREVGFHCRSWVIWYYTFGVNCVRKFTRSHTHLFHFVKDAKQFTFNDEAIRVPSARQLVYKDKRANPKGRIPDDTWILRPQDAPGLGGESDVWFEPRVCGTFKERQGWHGCQMPETILDRIIRVSSNTGDTVLDPFLGSGTTVVVAKKLGRKYIGFDISPEYVDNCRTRLDNTVET
ncbi:MAG: DNA-methyltransferase [Thermoguttaceae bacterium]